ncbi:CTD-3088G3.8 [Branchiostoma lanceolatum]|uniref:CTD-3088G3.8 protein n=1 Tax=Branchiostoma lanceolatum TaxID=7740 RepID=A0A8K0EVX9_BRALA|nr:CTD-3088G3.8 [Branchiostoma lanceolatum]
MNKLLLLLLGLCLAQASLRTEDVPVYDESQEYLYRYEGEIKSGIPHSSDRFSGMKIQSDIRLQFQTPKDVLMRLENIDLWTLRGELETPEEREIKNTEKASSDFFQDQLYKDAFKQDLFASSRESWWKSSSEEADSDEEVSTAENADMGQEQFTHFKSEKISEQEMAEFRRQLVKVIKFRYEIGKVWDLEASEDEPHWSVNIKRGILNLLQLKMNPLKSELLDRDDNDEAPNRSFDKSTGRVFRIMEKGVSGECETLYNIRDTLAGRNTREVTKIKDFQNCVERPEYSHSLHSAFIPNHQEDPKKMLQSTVTTHVGVLVDGLHPDRFTIQTVESRGQHVFQPHSNQGSNVVTYSRQNLKLVEFKELTKLVPAPTKLQNKGDLKYVFEQEDQDRLNGQEKTELTSARKKMIQRISRDLSVEMRGAIAPESPRKFMELVRELRNLNEHQLLEVLEDYQLDVPNKGSEHTTEEEAAKKQTRQIIIDALSLAGTKDSLKAVQKLVDTEKVSDNECEQLLSGIALSIEPCSTSTDTMLDIAKSKRSRNSPKIQKSAWFAFGTMVSGLVREQKEGQLEKKLPNDEEQTTQLMQKYSQNLLMCIEREKSDDEKLTCLKAVGNAGLESTVDRLEEIISGKDSDATSLELRVQAIYALRRVVKKLPNKIHNILYHVYNNPERDSEERIAAASLLIDPDVKPTSSFLQLVAQSTQRETSNQVGQFVYQYLKKISESRLPKDNGIRTAYTLALRLAKPFNRGLQYSQSKQFQTFDDKMKAGASLDLDIIGNKRSIWPRFAKANVELHALGYHMDLLEAGVRLEGLQPILESLYGKKSEEKNIFDYLKKKSKERGREDNAMDTQQLKHMNKMNQKLPIETRRPEEPRGHSYIKFYGNEIRFDQLKKEDIQYMIQQGNLPVPYIAEQLRKGVNLQLRKATKVVEASRQIPTELGVPLSLDVNSALLMKSGVSSKMEVRPRLLRQDRPEQEVQTVKLEIDSNHSAVLQVVGKMSVDCRVVQSGVALNVLVNTTFPVSGKLSLDLENKKYRLNIKAPDQERELFTLKSTPFVYTEQKMIGPTADGKSALPVIRTMNILGKKIQQWPTQVHTTFGREELGFEFTLDSKMISRLNKEKMSPIQPLTGPIELKLTAKPGLYPPTEADIELRQPIEESIRHLSPLERLVYTQQREMTNEFRLEIDILAKNQQHPRTMNIKIHSYDNQMTEDDLTSDFKEVRVSPRFPQRSSEEMEPEVSSETSKKMKMLTNKVLRKTVAVQIERSPIPTKESEDFKGCLNMEFEYPAMPEWRLIQDRKMKALIDAKWGRDCSGNDKMLKVNAKWQKSEEQRRQERCQEQQHISDVDSSEQDSNEELMTTCGDLKTPQKWNHFKECLKDRRDGLMYSPACRLAVEDRSLLRQLDIDIMHLNLPSWMEELSTSLKRYVYFTFFDRLSIDDIDVRNEENKVRIQVVTNKDQDVMNVSIHTPDEDAHISNIPIEQPKIKVDFSKILKLDVPLKLDWPLGFPLRFPSTKKSLKQQYMEVIFGSNQPAFCKIRPNDRIQTFDGVQYKYKVGTCAHVLAKDSSPEESFLVLVRKEDVEQPDKTFQVFLDGKKIELTTTQKSQSEEWTSKEEELKQVHVFIDGRQVEINPLKARQILKDEHDTNSPVLFSLSRFGDKVILMSQQHGLIVETDGHYVQVKVPSAYRGKLSGLCGNFDGEQDSEYEGPSQELYRSPSDFGLSYRIPSKEYQVNASQDQASGEDGIQTY